VPSCLGMMSGSAWLKLPSPWLPSTLTLPAAGRVSSWPAEGEMACTDPLVLPFFPPVGKTSLSASSATWCFWAVAADPFCTPRFPLGSIRHTGGAGSRPPFPSSASESEADTELLSDGDRDGDFLPGFSSFFLFFFFFLAACLLCFLVLASPSDSMGCDVHHERSYGGLVDIM